MPSSTSSTGSALMEIAALLEARVAACGAKDIDRLMSLYAPDCVYFDVVPPLHFTGADAIRRNFLRWFAEYEGPIELDTSNQEIALSGDVAFIHMLHRDSGNKNSEYSGVWLRSTVCCQQIDGTWLITHEHISLPIDWARSGTAVVDLKP